MHDYGIRLILSPNLNEDKRAMVKQSFLYVPLYV